ncbi:S8 family serine peptidase [Nocardioides sp. W3-2-3]|uniref:S8 family serine peptidase n=1 Tax=Nocardioides convexus TaxID=2712224 RepID=UPI0024184223|nr:S8 family serine peptidase [Nocardioides convexus]NHA00934.1 S8 family serine peptidase [Nocardioides convexus]
MLGDGTKIVGASISRTALPSTRLVDAAKAGNGSASATDTALCAPGSLDPAKATGVIVVCQRGVYDRVAKSAEVHRAGGAGVILANISEGSLDADFHEVPTIHVADTDSPKVYAYLDAAGSSATASFVLGNQTGKVTPVPQVAGFSSRGPAASDDSDLLKPDITAPGVSVLAAVAPPSNHGRDYDLYSGTSMSAPHIAGLAALVQGVHPGWTPMRIKSAMMTTATDLKTSDGGRSTDLFAQGAGHVDPRAFLDPGLFVLSDGEQWNGYLTGRGLDTGVPALAPNAVNVPSLAAGRVMRLGDPVPDLHRGPHGCLAGAHRRPRLREHVQPEDRRGPAGGRGDQARPDLPADHRPAQPVGLRPRHADRPDHGPAARRAAPGLGEGAHLGGRHRHDRDGGGPGDRRLHRRPAGLTRGPGQGPGAGGLAGRREVRPGMRQDR